MVPMSSYFGSATADDDQVITYLVIIIAMATKAESACAYRKSGYAFMKSLLF